MYMISLLQFPPRNVKCPRKATRRVLWRYSTFSSRRNVSISDVTIDAQPDVIIRYDIARVTYARELQAERKGMCVYTEYPKEISLNKRAVFQDHRSMAVNVQTVTDFHSDMKHTDSYSSVLPL